MNKQITLIYKNLLFYSKEEELLFMELVKKILSFNGIEKAKDSIKILLNVNFSHKNKPIIFWGDIRIL